MRCKCGGRLRKHCDQCAVYVCEDCGKRWEIDFSIYPIIAKHEIRINGELRLDHRGK